MNASQRIVSYFKELGDWRGERMARLRALILQVGPDLVEEWKWNTPVWSHNGNVLAIGAFANHVKVNLFKGASLSDPHGLFNAGLDAKTSRAIDIRRDDVLNEAAFKTLVRAAIALNRSGAKPKSEKHRRSRISRRQVMPKIHPYLSFNGTAAEAMRFYEKTLVAKLDALMKFGDMPDAKHVPPGSADKVIHSQLSLKDGATLMASDWIGGQPYEGMKGFSIALAYESAAEAKRVFEALAQGGLTIFPLQPSFFAETFGMVIDRFGAPWAISGGSRQG